VAAENPLVVRIMTNKMRDYIEHVVPLRRRFEAPRNVAIVNGVWYPWKR